MHRTLALVLILVLALPVAAQDATPLAVGRSVSGDLATGGADAYTLDLGAGQFVLGEAFQETVDVVVTVLGPDGATLRQFDGPARGPEPFQFTTEEAGAYTIRVTPFEQEQGAYRLVVRRAEPLATTPEGKVDQLFARYDRTDGPGALVAVVRGGEVVFERAYGMANLTHGIPMTTDTRSNIGSTSKQFTAYAVASLAEEGRLSLDDDVRDYIPELPDLGATVTLRHLLTHTSGYREFVNAFALAGRRVDEGDYVGHGEIIALVQRQPELQNAPGAEWNYNNTGFALLAEVVARVTGEPFADWMEAHVFAPSGMTSTVVRADPGQIVPHSAQGYGPDERGGFREVDDLGGAMGAGGMYSTLADLARWMRLYHDPDADPAIRAMTTPYVLAGGDTTVYGLGVFLDEERGLRRIQHGGADLAHRTEFRYYPDLDAGLIVMSNDASFGGGIVPEVAEAFFGDHMETDEPAEDEPVATDFDPASYDPADFDAYVGRYELLAMPGFILTFSREGDRLLTQATGQPQVDLVPTSDSTFALTVVEAGLTFHRDAGGAVTGLTLHQGGDHPARRLAEEAEPVDLAAYAGRYYSAELEAAYTIAAEDGALVLRHRRLDDITLTPNAGETFSGSFPVATITFERDDAGNVTGLRVGNGRTRDVSFERQE